MTGNRRGATLLELVFAIGLSLVILSVGTKTYFAVARADEIESRRESAMLTAQNLMARIKKDIRSGSGLRASGNSLTITARGRQTTYKSGKDGVARLTCGARSVYHGIAASFSPSGHGAGINLVATDRVHRRPIHVEISSFASPR